MKYLWISNGAGKWAKLGLAVLHSETKKQNKKKNNNKKIEMCLKDMDAPAWKT